MQAYTKQTRHEWLVANLERIEARNLSYHDIGLELKAQFSLDRPPSTATVGRALKAARDEGIQPYSEEATRLLQPENFPEARVLFFDYDTSKTQHALYWVLYCLTLKVDLPAWVIEHFDLPEDINTDIVEKEKLLTFILLVAPRHGKTMTMIHGLILIIALNPDVRVIYCQGIATTTEDILGLIMLEMETNELLRSMYGPFQSDDRQWSKVKGIIVARRTRHSITPTFLPVGITSNVRSRDADILVIDDPQDIERAESEATTSKDYRKLTTEFMTRREPHTPVLMVGSHLPTLFGDVFTQLEDNLDALQTDGQTILLRKRPAHNLDICNGQEPHHECLEWPEYRDWNFLESQRVLLDTDNPGMYEAVYQQEARIPGARPFAPDVVKATLEDGGVLDLSRSWKIQTPVCPRCEGRLYTTIGFDPAAGESKKASFSALSVLDGCIACHTLFLIDYWQKRQSPELHASTIRSFAKSFDIHYLKVEINAYQKALARDSQLREAARELNFTIDEHMTDDRKNTAEFGIPNLARYMTDDKFSIPYATFEDQQYATTIISSLVRYPKKPNDLPMSLWLAASMMWEVWELYADQEPIYLPGRDERVPQYMISDPLVIDLAKDFHD